MALSPDTDDFLNRMMDENSRASKKEREDLLAQLAGVPHTFQLKGLEQLGTNHLKRLKSGLKSALSVGYNTRLETARARNLLAYALFRLDRLEEALQQLELVLNMEAQHANLVTLANKAVMLLQGNSTRAQDQVQLLRQIQTDAEDGQYLVVKAKAELAFSYTRVGPRFCRSAIGMFKEVIPEAREPEKWLWKFGLALTERRFLRANPRLSLMQPQDISERVDLLRLFLEVAEHCASDNLKAKAYSEVALLLNMVRPTSADDLNKEAGMTPVEACKKALELDGNDRSVLCKCGKVYRYARKTEESCKLLEKATAIRPSATAYHHLGLTFKALANQEKSKGRVNVPGETRQSEHEQIPCQQSPESTNPDCPELSVSLVTEGSATTSTRGGAQDSKFSKNPDVRAMQVAIKSPLKGTTRFSREDKFVKETLEYLERAVKYSKRENTSAIYDLAIMHKSLGEMEQSRSCLQLMVNKPEGMLPLDYAKAYEQMGLVLKEMAESEEDQREKKRLLQESKSMLMIALKNVSQMFDGCPGIQIGEVWRSFPTLLELVKDSDLAEDKKLKEKALLFQLIKNHRQSLDLLHEIERMDPDKANDPECLKLRIEAYVKAKDYEKATTFFELLKCTEQSVKALFEDKDFMPNVYLQAARQAILNGCGSASKAHFRHVFHDTVAANQNDRRLQKSSPSDRVTSFSTKASRDASPEVPAEDDGLGAMSGSGPTVESRDWDEAVDSRDWDVVLLHEEDSIQKADSLIHVLQTTCGIRVTSRHRALDPGTPEWVLVNVMEKSYMVAILAETDDHNDDLFSYLIGLAAQKSSTVSLLIEGSQPPPQLKGHRSFRCPDQLLHFKDEPHAQLDEHVVNKIVELFAFLCECEVKFQCT